MKNSKIVMLVLLIAAMVVAACGTPATEAPEAEPTEAPAEPTEEMMEEEMGMDWSTVDPSGQTVIFWHQHSREREEALIALATEFNETNEFGITVEPVYMGSYGDIFQQMLLVMNTGDAPGLVVAYQNQAATYQLADSLVDMNSLVNDAQYGLTAEEQADFFPAFFNSDVFPNFGGARLGLAPNRSMEVMYYNAEWLAELGYDAPPATPEEFAEMACAATEQPFSKATAEGSRGYELSIDASRFASWTFAFGGDVFDYETGEFSYNSEAAVEAWTFLQGLFDQGCATVVTEDFGDQTNFGQGTTLFTVGSSSGLPFYDSAVSEGAQFEWSVAPLPHTTADPVMNIYGASVSIPKTTPEQELASWIFVKYYTSPEVQAEWSVASNYFPVRASSADTLGDYFVENPRLKAAFDLLQFGVAEPPVPGYDFVRDMIEQQMAVIVEGGDVQGILDDANEEANSILAEQLEQMN